MFAWVGLFRGDSIRSGCARLRRGRSSGNRSSLTFLSLFLLSSGSQALAYITTTPPISSYIKLGQGYSSRVDSLEVLIASFEVEEVRYFDECMTDPDGDGYWWCSKRTVASVGPAAYNDGFVNGEPNDYSLPLERYVNYSNFSGYGQYAEPAGAIGATTTWSCPAGFVKTVSGPRDNQTLWCERSATDVRKKSWSM